MKEMFLLGAGASVEAGIPDSYKMTRQMLDTFSQDIHLQKENKILRFVIGGLLFQKGSMGENPYDGVNIEELFSAVQLLANRGDIELGPFISSWHPLLDDLELGEVSSYDARKLLEFIYEPIIRFDLNDFSKIRQSLHQSLFMSQTHELQSILEDIVHQIISSRGGELFRATSQHMIRKLINVVWIEDSKRVEYLIPLLRYSLTKNATENNITIATLNYDNSIELSGLSTAAPVDTGFESWSNTGDFDFKTGDVPLIKLHGSIDWALSDGKTSNEKPLSYQALEKVDPTNDTAKNFMPALIFGGKNKLTAKGPFLNLLRTFEQKLKECMQLNIIGYSFRDDHINEYIQKWINGDSERVIKIIDPNISKLKTPFIESLKSIECD